MFSFDAAFIGSYFFPADLGFEVTPRARPGSFEGRDLFRVYSGDSTFFSMPADYDGFVLEQTPGTSFLDRVPPPFGEVVLLAGMSELASMIAADRKSRCLRIVAFFLSDGKKVEFSVLLTSNRSSQQRYTVSHYGISSPSLGVAIWKGLETAKANLG